MRNGAIILIITFVFTLFSPLTIIATERMTPVVTAVERVHDAVVNIRAEAVKPNRQFVDPFFEEFMGWSNSYKSQNLGTGVIIRNDGIIVTNYHVVEAATNITVVTPDEKSYTASVIGGDSLLDIAIIKINDSTKRLPSLTLGSSSDIHLGETVIAIGNPYGLNSSVTTGVVSNTKRIMKMDNDFAVFIQTDALINPGNSGGPLINLDGEVIGINSAIYKDAQGIGFAIPIDSVKRVLPEILQYQRIRRGYLGFSLTKPKTSDAQGLYISDVATNSDASRIGIKRGDYLVKLDDIPVADAQSVNYILRTFPPGQSIKITYVQQGVETGAYIKLSEFPKNFGVDMLKYNYKIDIFVNNGYLTVRSSEYPQYIRTGDVILAINNKEVKTLSQIDTMLVNSAYEKLKLTISRDRRIFDITLTP